MIKKQLKKIRLTESELHNIIKKSVMTTINESYNSSFSVVRCDEARDKDEACQWISDEFGDTYEEVMGWFDECSINWYLSAKGLNDKGETAGFLLMSDYNIEDESATIADDEPELLADLNSLNYIAGFAFLINPKYRGTRLHYQMLRKLYDVYKNYDFIFIPVRHELRTHNYWKHMGAVYFYEDEESKYYIIPQSNRAFSVLEKHRLNESVVNRVVTDVIMRLIKESEQRALQTNIFGGVDDETEKNKKVTQKKKKAEQARIRRQEKKEEKAKEERRRQHDEDSKRMLNGGLFGSNI